ncbi:8809_t:CDS:1, partial [Gigaspora rosea]
MGQQFVTINRRFAQLEQAKIGSTEGNSNTHSNTEQATSTQHIQINSQEPICVTSTGSNVDQFEGNYPLTPTLNRLIIEASMGAQSHEKHEKNGIVKYKKTSRKFPAIDYSEVKPMPTVQGL